MGDIAVCVCSCDAYEDIWDLFFRFFEKYWKECRYPIYLNTEQKNYRNTAFDVICLNDERKTDSWSQRLIRSLERIPEKYVLVILDDFFILDNVVDSEVDKCAEIMEKHENIACFHYCHMSDAEGAYTKLEFENYKKRDIRKRYWVNFLPALWRKQALIDLLSPYENAWQAEWFGTERAKLSGWDFYTLGDKEAAVIDYDITLDKGYGLCQGKWTHRTEELFKREGIQVDMARRGFCDPDSINSSVVYPRMIFRHKLQYLLYGGVQEEDVDMTSGKMRIPIRKQILLFLKHPRFFLGAIKNKLECIMNRNVGRTVDTKSGAFLD